MSEKYSIAVIGLGNDFRADDAVGLYIARCIREKNIPNIRVIEGVSDGTTLIETWKNTGAAFIIDCVHSGSYPGRIFRFNALTEKIPEKLFPSYSTHAFNITKAFGLAESIGQLPQKLLVYGIEGTNFTLGTEISEVVKTAAGSVVELILKDIENFQ